MRAEIKLRIQNHTPFVTTKIVTVGAMLGFMSTKAFNFRFEFRAFGFFLIPLISMFYDIMIAKNIQNIHRIATFIRDVIETQDEVKHIKLWETYAG